MAEESERDRQKRIAREAREMLRSQNQGEIQKRLDNAADAERGAEKRMGKAMDDEFDRGIRDIFGDDLSELKNALENSIPDVSDKDIKKAQDAIAEGVKLRNKGKDASARRYLKKHKGAISKGVKKAKENPKKKGCFSVLVVLATAGAGALYGAYETVSYIAS